MGQQVDLLKKLEISPKHPFIGLLHPHELPVHTIPETCGASDTPILTAEFLAYFNPGVPGRLYEEFLDRAILIYSIE